jgi:hypothetical protein
VERTCPIDHELLIPEKLEYAVYWRCPNGHKFWSQAADGKLHEVN